MAKYKLVIFDSDGTLADTLPWFRNAFHQLADQYGFKPLTDTDHQHLRTLSTREMLDYLKVPLWRIPALIAGMRRLMAEHIDEFSLFDGIGESLRELSVRGIVLGVVSTNSRENVRDILGTRNAGLIGHYACGASMFGKPSKLRTLLRSSGASAQDAIYIGDEMRDGEAARKVGMAYGAVSWGYHSLDMLRELAPAEIFTKPADIGEKLR